MNLEPLSSKKEVQIRLFLSQLPPLELEVLREILHGSLRIPFSDLEEALNISTKKLEQLIQPFTLTGLLASQNGTLFVDKEKRRLFEAEIERLESDFEPGMQYVQQLLQKVPLEYVFDWYQLGRGATHVFESLMERLFQTPRQYERYLADLQLEDSRLKAILSDLFSSDELSLFAKEIRKKYKLSEQEFEEIAFHLELRLVAFVRYTKKGQVLEPLHEWRQFQLNQKAKLPKTIKPSLVKEDPKKSPNLELYRKTLISYIKNESIEAVERSVREIEKGLASVETAGWVQFNEFIKGFSGHVGQSKEVRLERVGTKWHYRRPTYSTEEVEFIEKVIFELFVHSGTTVTGTYQGKRCFRARP